jgi:hypothetical protein
MTREQLEKATAKFIANAQRQGTNPKVLAAFQDTLKKALARHAGARPAGEKPSPEKIASSRKPQGKGTDKPERGSPEKARL